MGNEVVLYEAVENGELEIDSQGRIWRVKQRVCAFGRIPDKKVLRTITVTRRRAETTNKDIYQRVSRRINDKQVFALAHRLVWLHFNGPIPDRMTVNHENGIKDDNRPENLELATQQEQLIHAKNVLGKKVGFQPKITEEDVRTIRARATTGESQKSIADDYPITRPVVNKIVNRKIWKHIR